MTFHDVPRKEEVDALLAGHALGDLDADERQRLAGLLERNPALRQRLDEFQTTLELLPLALPATVEPPPRLRRRLLAREESPGRRRPSTDGSVRGWLVPAALGIALLGLGFELHQTRQDLAQLQRQLLTQAPLTRSPEAAVIRRLPLAAAVPGLRANGEVMVTGNPSHNVLMLNDLPPPPAHHVYRLWANVDGRRVGCVSFVPTEQGHVGMLIPPMPTSLATSVSVSVESDPVGAAPQGPMLLSSRI
ncbi:anti-sigma factor [Cyanobium sp. FGCU-52]|nr:anti-sigma factor [Cyanobium sp. FGCU52]